jgi:hypothetical protein
MSDLKGGTPADWLVIGWFTPDYRPLAEAFAANLAEHNAPYHLFSRPKAGGWSALQKPAVVLEAMDAHRGKTLILMDVDCIVRAGIAEVASIEGDMSAWMRTKSAGQNVSVFMGSRVMVFRPTEGARALAQEWERRCATINDDEHALTWAYLTRREVACSHLYRRYSGVEEAASDRSCIIVHRSAHGGRKDSTSEKVIRWIKLIERPFRTGRSRRRAKRVA